MRLASHCFKYFKKLLTPALLIFAAALAAKEAADAPTNKVLINFLFLLIFIFINFEKYKIFFLFKNNSYDIILVQVGDVYEL